MDSFYLKADEETVVAVINDLVELKESLSNSDTRVINHHINDSKNDFATWIDEAIGNNRLAFKIALITGDNEGIKDQMIRVLDKELNKISIKQVIMKLFKKKS